MLPTNFENLARQLPEYSSVVERIGAWAHAHSDWAFLDPRILSRDLRDIDAFQLALTLRGMVRAGSYRQVYKVVTPDGVLAEGEYESPIQIPQRITDGFNQEFTLDQGDIVPVFKPVA